MLEEYKNIESKVYKQMHNSLSGNLSHAYLFNTNDNVYAKDMINEFAVSILSIESENDIDTIRKRVQVGNYSDLKIIEPDGLLIKKEQIDNLQKDFSTKSIEGNKKVYIIYGADLLNQSSANSLLKFLEEPLEGIYALLITNKINKVLKTISSRCQIITFTKNNVEDFISFNKIKEYITEYKLMYAIWNDLNINNREEYTEFLTRFIKFINYYESNGIKSLTKIKTYFFDYFVDKEKMLKFFEYMILFYRDVLHYKLENKVLYFDDYINLISDISSKYSTTQILQKLSVILDKEKLIKSNANLNMIIDSLLINMEDVC